MQHLRMGAPEGQHDVSILTRPGGRVQRWLYQAISLSHSFNPHPSRRTGATFLPVGHAGTPLSFNPHPSRRTGATAGLLPPRSTSGSFNPHPSRRTGATGR